MKRVGLEHPLCHCLRTQTHIHTGVHTRRGKKKGGDENRVHSALGVVDYTLWLY